MFASIHSSFIKKSICIIILKYYNTVIILKKIKRSQCIDITKNIKIHEKNMKNTIKIKEAYKF